MVTNYSVIQKPRYTPDNTPVEHPRAEVAPPLNQPRFITPTPAPEVIKEAEPEPMEPSIDAAIPSMSFSDAETQHIKFSEYNPFPQGENTFTVDLEQMRSQFTYPVANARFSSGYGTRSGRMHTGVDLLNDAGEPIFAALDGTVRFSKSYFGYGNVIVIRHTNGLETVYSHNSKNIAKVGDRVKSGDKIALVGRTGQATANHLHFEVRVMGQTINPALMLDLKSNTLRDGMLKITRNGSTISAINQSRYITQNAEKPTAKAQPETTPKPSSAATTHTIVRGDTLYSIARTHGTTVDEICRLNSITAKTILALGRKLKVK